jgi:uncharacterized membrane protein
MTASDPSLDRLERNLGRLLQAGVFTAAACLALGLVAFISVGQSRFSTLTLTLGLIVLMATPIMRVVVSLVAYVRMRDWFFVTTTVTVFVLLIVTVTLAWRRAAGG